MITFTVYKNSRDITGFSVACPTTFSSINAEKVFAAVSMLVLNTVNAIEMYTKDEVDITKDGRNNSMSIAFHKEISNETWLLVKTLVLGMESLKELYTNIKITNIVKDYNNEQAG